MSAIEERIIQNRQDFMAGHLSPDEASAIAALDSALALIREAEASKARNILHAAANAAQARSLELQEISHKAMLAEVARRDQAEGDFAKVWEALEKMGAKESEMIDRINMITQNYQRIQTHIDEALELMVNRRFENIASLLKAATRE